MGLWSKFATGLRIILGLFALLVVWIGFQLGTHRHTGILRTLAEAKQLLARVQQAVVAAQAHEHAVLRPDCSSCGGGCHIQDWRVRQVATLFGLVAVRLPRFRCVSCRHGETGTSWPSHCR